MTHSGYKADCYTDYSDFLENSDMAYKLYIIMYMKDPILYVGNFAYNYSHQMLKKNFDFQNSFKRPSIKQVILRNLSTAPCYYFFKYHSITYYSNNLDPILLD